VRGTKHEHEHMLMSIYIEIIESNNDTDQKLPIWS